MNSYAWIDKHPYMIIENLVAKYGSDLEFELTRYKSLSGHQLSNPGYITKVMANDFTRQNVIDWIESLGEGEDLALRSIVHCGDEIRHIPMIDFYLPRWSEDIKSRLTMLTSHQITDEYKIYSSGRSFHGYSPMLIDHDEWVMNMGTLLLMNKDESPPLIDARWIGRRLAEGCGCLRWSSNSSHYHSLPSMLCDGSNV